MEDNDSEEIIERSFRCKICNKTHIIKLNKNISKGRDKFPFPYVFLHDHIHEEEYNELLTILYIDKNLQIRHSEVQILDYDSIFSKEQVVAIIKPLLEEISILRSELESLKKEYNLLKKNKIIS
jgi:hypothetical protein